MDWSCLKRIGTASDGPYASVNWDQLMQLSPTSGSVVGVDILLAHELYF